MSKILIVEDEESIAELEKDYLELSGFEVHIETNGETGLKEALEGDYDLILLDLMLHLCLVLMEPQNSNAQEDIFPCLNLF